jgi:hypothetical protein
MSYPALIVKKSTRGSISDENVEEEPPEHKSDGDFKTECGFIYNFNVVLESKIYE